MYFEHIFVTHIFQYLISEIADTTCKTCIKNLEIFIPISDIDKMEALDNNLGHIVRVTSFRDTILHPLYDSRCLRRIVPKGIRSSCTILVTFITSAASSVCQIKP